MFKRQISNYFQNSNIIIALIVQLISMFALCAFNILCLLCNNCPLSVSAEAQLFFYQQVSILNIFYHKKPEKLGLLTSSGNSINSSMPPPVRVLVCGRQK